MCLLDFRHPDTCQSYEEGFSREGDSGISDILNIFCDRIFRLSNEDAFKLGKEITHASELASREKVIQAKISAP